MANPAIPEPGTGCLVCRTEEKAKERYLLALLDGAEDGSLDGLLNGPGAVCVRHVVRTVPRASRPPVCSRDTLGRGLSSCRRRRTSGVPSRSGNRSRRSCTPRIRTSRRRSAAHNARRRGSPHGGVHRSKCGRVRRSPAAHSRRRSRGESQSTNKELRFRALLGEHEAGLSLTVV
jgi:hypothetical protein